MESAPDLEAVTRLLAEHRGAGRVVGARRRSDTASDVVLTTIRRSSDGYTVRHVVIDLDRLVRDAVWLFDPGPPDPPCEYTEEVLLDPEEAVRAASARSAQPVLTPVPALAEWKALGGPFEEQFRWSTLRPHVDGFPRRPTWRRAVRSALVVAGAALVVVLNVLGAGYQVSGYDDDASLTDYVFFGLVAFAALGAFVLVLLSIGWGLECYQRHRPPSAGKPGGRHAAP